MNSKDKKILIKHFNVVLKTFRLISREKTGVLKDIKTTTKLLLLLISMLNATYSKKTSLEIIVTSNCKSFKRKQYTSWDNKNITCIMYYDNVYKVSDLESTDIKTYNAVVFIYLESSVFLHLSFSHQMCV